LKSDPDKRFDLPADIARIFLALRDTPVEEPPPPPPRKIGPQKLSWSVMELTQAGKLCIVAKCATCSQGSTVTDYTGTRKALHFCCGQGAPVPAEVAKEYRRLLLSRQEGRPPARRAPFFFLEDEIARARREGGGL